MSIQNIKTMTGMRAQTTVPAPKANTASAFADALKAKREDSIEISQRAEPEAGVRTKKCSYADDPYNKGIPCGKTAENVLNTLAQLRQEADSIDYAGMSDEEIFRTIYNRYDKAFGGNFSGALSGGLNVVVKDGPGLWHSINCSNQMFDEVHQKLSPDTIKQLTNENGKWSSHIREYQRNALYGHMSKEERLTYISRKHPGGGQTTLEYCSYLSDMAQAGLMPEKEATSLIRTETSRAFYKAIQNEADCRSMETFERAANISMTGKSSLEERFSYFKSTLVQKDDQALYDELLDDFLERIAKYRN